MKDLLLHAEGTLYLLELKKLKGHAEKLKVPKRDVFNNIRSTLAKLLSVVYEESCENSTQQGFKALLSELKKFPRFQPVPWKGMTKKKCPQSKEVEKVQRGTLLQFR